MSSLENINQWLKENKTSSLQLQDQHFNVIEEVVNYDDLVDFDNSLSNYLDYLFTARAYQVIYIQKQRKKGNNRVNAGSNKLKVTPENKKSVVESGAKNVVENSHVGSTQQQLNYIPMQHQQQQFQQPPQQGLNAPAGMQHAEWIKHLTNSERYKEQYDRAQKYESKYDAEKEKNETLKAQLLEFTIGEKSKPGLAETIMDVVKQNPEIVSAIASARGGGGASAGGQQIPGLSGASNLSPANKGLIAKIVQSPLEDDMVDRVFLLIQQYMTGNNTFIDVVEPMFQKIQPQEAEQQ